MMAFFVECCRLFFNVITGDKCAANKRNDIIKTVSV